MQIFSFIDGIQTLQAILLISGLVFMIVEVFTPGFGVAGGTGLLLLIIGIVLTARTWFEAFVMFVILLLVVGLLLFFILRSAKNGTLQRKMVLSSASSRENGYSATPNLSAYLGQKGTAITVLRPAGSADFDGERLDVVSEGDFIVKGTVVIVTAVEGRRIVVEPAVDH